MKKYNLSEIMHKAWKLYRKGVSSFAEALHRAWNSAKAAPVNAQRIEEAQQAAGITEPVNTWARRFSILSMCSPARPRLRPAGLSQCAGR